MRPGVEEQKLSVEFQVAGSTDVGRLRRTNQDAFEIVPPLGLAVICDGMGGPAGGEVASKVALESFVLVARQELEASRGGDGERSKRALCRAAAAANRAVRARASYDTRFRGMGTTLVAARLDGNEITVVNIGDSRAYLVCDGVTRQVTLDHSFVAEQVRMGLMTPGEAKRSPYQAAITRAIGIDEDVQPDFFTNTVQPGDALLLCSDGLMRHMHDDEIGMLLADGAIPPSEICARLIATVNARGGTDNVTCVVMRFGPVRADA